MSEFHILSLRENPHLLESCIAFFIKHWADENTIKMYEDGISCALKSDNFFPQWYMGIKEDKIIACCGLITNDFISRMDLYPWLCALFVEEEYRLNHYAKMLVQKAKLECKNAGFKKLYLCSDLEDFYEKLGFDFLTFGYHPWGEKSKIYESSL